MHKLYNEAALVIKQALNKEKSIRAAIYSSKYKSKKQLMRLCCEALKERALLDHIVESSIGRTLLQNSGIKDFALLYVLLYEFLKGNGLRKASKRFSSPIFAAEKEIRLLESEFEASKPSTSGEMSSVRRIPRYARVNTLKWSLDECVKALETDDWKVTELDSEESFVDAVGNMSESDVFLDVHVPGVLVFPPDTDLHAYWMVVQGCIFLQDKASCLPAMLLKPKLGSHVFDVCAAPGMKTTQLCALLENSGKVWAMDKSAERVEILRSIVQTSAATNASVFCGDFLRCDVFDKKFAKVRYVLVDPPCSGSGIVKRMDRFVNSDNDFDERRLRSLGNLQAMILKHALKFPNVKKVVYSTCSIYEEENEKVIEEILSEEALSEKFKLVNAYPSWTHRGLSTFPFGAKCLRAKPDLTLTNGFFVAVLKRKKASL